MTKYLIGIVFSIIIVYGFIKAWPLLAGPALYISSPTNNATYQDGIVDVVGNTKRASTLMLNGAPVLHDQNGDFSSTLTFPRGGSILTFTATDRFGKTVSETRSIFVPFEN